MGYGIIPFMISADQINSIWGSGLSITKGNAIKHMEDKLGFSFLAKQLATEILSSSNNTIKKDSGIKEFRAHVAMQDLFTGTISYPTVPFVYSLLLKGIANKLSLHYTKHIGLDFEKMYPDISKLSEDRRGPSDAFKNYIYSRTQLTPWINMFSGQLPNDQWYPCNLSIIDLLTYSTPMPIPEPEDFPFISTIRNKDLMVVFENVEKADFPGQSKEQMLSWFNLCIQEKRDIMLFLG